jgi:hypothetical protein
METPPGQLRRLRLVGHYPRTGSPRTAAEETAREQVAEHQAAVRRIIEQGHRS